MVDTRTMAELLQAPTEGYGDAIVIPAAGGNLLTKTPKDALTLIENKSKVRTSRNRPVVAKVSTNTSTSGLSPNVAALIDAVKALLLKNTTHPPASVKAVEERGKGIIEKDPRAVGYGACVKSLGVLRVNVYLIFDEVLEDIDSTNYTHLTLIIDFFLRNLIPLLEEFAGELALINPIPPGIDEVDFDPEGDTRLIEKLPYDNSSPRPPEELNSEDIIEFFSAFPIPIEGNEDLVAASNNYSVIFLSWSMIQFHFDLSDTSLHLADKSDSVFEKFDDELAHIISPPEYDCFYFDISTGLVVSFLSRIEQGLSTREYLIKIVPDYEDSRARSFVQHSVGLHPFACLFWESYILDLIDRTFNLWHN
ncbi:hypothetical protein Tco_1393287 [Tanacetum coccineum]